MIKLKFELCRLNAKMPTKATPGSACFDICAATDYEDILLPGQPLIIPTGLKVEIPEGYAIAAAVTGLKMVSAWLTAWV